MAIELAGLATPATPGQTINFQFANQVMAYVLGIEGFNIGYGDGNDHWVQQMSINLSPSQSGTGGNVVSAVVNMVLHDDSGHQINPLDASVSVICIAVTGSPDKNTVMGNFNGIQTGDPGVGVTLPYLGSGYSIVSAFQSGFDFQFADGDHQVQQAQAGCSLTYSGILGSITANGILHDAKGNSTQPKIDAGIIASTDSGLFGSAVVSSMVNGVQVSGPQEVTIPQLQGIGQAVVLIQDWNVQYGSAHNLATLGVATASPQFSADNNIVTLPVFEAVMCDNSLSGHNQENSVSYVTGLVFALPPA